jgi:hypothetical protein
LSRERFDQDADTVRSIISAKAPVNSVGGLTSRADPEQGLLPIQNMPTFKNREFFSSSRHGQLLGDPG